ncbi:hypothetical protein [Paenibacillus oceani]|nr:hypothetical protein [Paenibacillus oceani]
MIKQYRKNMGDSPQGGGRSSLEAGEERYEAGAGGGLWWKHSGRGLALVSGRRGPVGTT